jgi:hypothetical protein
MAYMFGNVDEDDALATPVDASVTTESTQLRQGAIVCVRWVSVLAALACPRRRVRHDGQWRANPGHMAGG